MLQLLKAFELFKKKVIFVTLIVKAFVRLTIHELRMLMMLMLAPKSFS